MPHSRWYCHACHSGGVHRVPPRLGAPAPQNRRRNHRTSQTEAWVHHRPEEPLSLPPGGLPLCLVGMGGCGRRTYTPGYWRCLPGMPDTGRLVGCRAIWAGQGGGLPQEEHLTLSASAGLPAGILEFHLPDARLHFYDHHVPLEYLLEWGGRVEPTWSGWEWNTVQEENSTLTESEVPLQSLGWEAYHRCTPVPHTCSGGGPPVSGRPHHHILISGKGWCVW